MALKNVNKLSQESSYECGLNDSLLILKHICFTLKKKGFALGCPTHYT